MKSSTNNSRTPCAVLDCQSIAPYRPVDSAIHTFMHPSRFCIVECDVFIAGGGTGGVAAATALARLGIAVCLSEETDWLGGQFTSQGVSALDEHDLIENFGGTAGYYEFRKRVRQLYLEQAGIRPGRCNAQGLNPGKGWVSRLCFEPHYGQAAVAQMFANSIKPPRIFLRTKPYHAVVRNNQVVAIRCYHFMNSEVTEFRADFFLDATEMGDLLELCKDAWVIGAESRGETGEPDALPGPSQPALQQCFTYPFCVRWQRDGRKSVKAPPDYANNRVIQPYTLMHRYADERGWVRYWMFRKGRGAMGPFWTYRRLRCGSLFGGRSPEDDISMINWPGNDFRGRMPGMNLREAALALQRAQRLSLGFLHWLQTECPRDDGGTGYPEIQLAASAMGTRHGLSKHPYVRESRRLLAKQRVLQQDIARRFQEGARARLFKDSVGIGWYAIDIHSGGPGESASSEPAAPFQIPLGALVSNRLNNLIPAAKNIGVTHITNGAFRLHPVEWNIGESAGILAAFCQERKLHPDFVLQHPKPLKELQAKLISHGVPLFWIADIPLGDPLFASIQKLAVYGYWPIKEQDLFFHPDEPASTSEMKALEISLKLNGVTANLLPCMRRQLAEHMARLLGV